MFSQLPSSSRSLDLPGPLGARTDLMQRDQRLRAMKELVGQLAHSFNNSLAPLTGYVTLLAEEIQGVTPAEQYLKKFDGSVRKAQGLIEVLVQATHPEKQFLPKRVDLRAVLERIAETWRKELPDGAGITVGIDAVRCPTSLDEGQWTKLIQHLLSNAQYALAEGGSLSISLQLRTLTPARAAELGMAETELWCMVFQDTGCGMTGEILERACDPLFTTRPQSSMTGLGLTVVHSVVHLHGGQLVLESAPGEGTTVTIWLPVTET